MFIYQSLQPGQSLLQGAYTIQRTLSKGGMGVIYLATDHHAFDRTVVIKEMLDYFDPNNPQEVQSAQQRFLFEAKTLSALRHPSIPQIYTYFQDGAHNYIVMEYIEGYNLEQRLTHTNPANGIITRGKPYPREDVVRWGIVLCRVLEYLSSRTPPVVHNDIKPANILLDSNSNDVRLVDFGTAKARLLVQSGGSVGLQKSSVYGTVGYAAREQYQGQSTPLSDVYALAATLYHLATDDDPRAHPGNFPQLHTLGPFGQCLRAALSKEVHQRPTAQMFRQQLEHLLTTHITRPIQAPDGKEITNEQELAYWCERQWEQATLWFYGKLPDQVEDQWAKNKLAADMRSIITTHRFDVHAGLDEFICLIDPASASVFRAPDGTEIVNMQQLVAWCERYWSVATDWLYGRMPRQIEHRWHNRILAQEIRAITKQFSSDHDAGLDAVLRLCDPQFPVSHIHVTPTSLDYGVMIAGQHKTKELTLQNTGRGYAIVTLERGTWLTPATNIVRLRPGQSTHVLIEADSRFVGFGGKLKETLIIRSQHGLVLHIPAVSRLPLWQTPLVMKFTNLLLSTGIGALIGAIVMIFLSKMNIDGLTISIVGWAVVGGYTGSAYTGAIGKRIGTGEFIMSSMLGFAMGMIIGSLLVIGLMEALKMVIGWPSWGIFGAVQGIVIGIWASVVTK